MDQSSFASKRQKRLFYDKNIWLSVLIVSIPSLILAFMAGAYAFSDQILMVKLIPGIWHIDSSDYAKVLVKHPDLNLLDPTNEVSDIIRTCVSYSAPVTVFINAMALLMGNGTAINYSKYNGSKNIQMAEKTWTQGFWCNLILSLISILIVCVFCNLFVTMEQGNGLNSALNDIKGKVNDSEFNTIKQYYDNYYHQVKSLTTQYIYVIGVGSIFCLYSQFISLLVIAEGRQWVVIFASTICNLLNVLFDFLMIKYGHITFISGAIAMVLGWFLNTLICFGYIWWLDRQYKTNLHLKALRKINFVFRDYLYLFKLGLPSFCRNLSMALASTIQIALIVHVVTSQNGIPVAEYQTFYGAINPIYNLFWTAQVGIINGVRVVCSYNHGARNFKRVRQSYWILIVIAATYGILMFFIICYGLNGPLLSLFEITSHRANYGLCNIMLKATILQMPIISIAIGGMMLFQATGLWWRACITGLMQGLICCVPISFTLQAIAISSHNINIFIWTPFIVALVASLANTIWSIIYMYKHFVNHKLNKLK